jgi:hypothetical protein
MEVLPVSSVRKDYDTGLALKLLQFEGGCVLL